MTQICPRINGFQYLSRWNPNLNVKHTPKVLVVTAFLQKDEKFLVLQRARNDVQHMLWGIPGGKLNKKEFPLTGLIREIQEETNLSFQINAFTLLNTAISHTSCDGEYGLYIYYASTPQEAKVKINLEEHHAFRWVTTEEFEKLELLTAQREAFLLVKEDLRRIAAKKTIKSTSKKLCLAV